MRFSKISVLAVLAAVMFFASSATAAVVVGGADGWSFSTDGMVNLFAVYQSADDVPLNVVDAVIGSTSQDGFRIKSGFLPGILAFNIKAPTMKGLDTGARIGFYPEPSNENRKNTFDGQIDLREIFFTVDGSFGQVMVGKGLSLFLGQNLLTEQTLMGVGRLAGALNADVGPTLGRIGYGYVYPNFNAQFRYTTPDMAGFKLAVGIYDPSRITSGVGFLNSLDTTLFGLAGIDLVGTAATETKLPRVEYELSYAGTTNGTTFKAWVNGLWQEAELTNVAVAGSNQVGDDVTAWGVGGGFLVGLGGFEFVASGFTGEGLGRSLMLDTEALDATGEERETWGYIVQGTYTFANEGKTKLGVSYGANEYEETSLEETVRTATGIGELETASMLTFMLTHDITSNLKIVGEVSLIEHEWFNGEDWEAEMYSLGTFFLW